jgi:predicted DNA repair protein MutK
MFALHHHPLLSVFTKSEHCVASMATIEETIVGTIVGTIIGMIIATIVRIVLKRRCRLMLS